MAVNIQFSQSYHWLSSWILANIIQLATQDFCDRFVDYRMDPGRRLYDQMVMAARCGVANIAEGSARHSTSVETEMRKQWKQRVMKCKNEEILIDGNSLLTLLENAKCYAVMVLEEKKEEAVVEKVLGYMMNVGFYDTVNNASDIFIKAIVDMLADLGDDHER